MVCSCTKYEGIEPCVHELKAMVQCVRKLHKLSSNNLLEKKGFKIMTDGYCEHCKSSYPCSTIKALDGEQR